LAPATRSRSPSAQEARYIWWNFVASSPERIEEAKAEWRAQNWGKGRFDLPIDDRDEHVRLPD
jgi:hypothetical protein